MNQELNSRTSTTEYNKALEEVNAMYASGLPYLEKAHELDPKNAATVELLKNLSFRLRDYDGMQTKYEKYNELFKSMSAE